MAAETYTHLLVYGNYANYLAIGTKDPDKLYFCQDIGKLFKGEVDFSNNFKSGTSSETPSVANAIPGFIYYETDTKKFKTKIGNALVEIGTPIDAVGDSTTHTLSASSADDHTPSSKNVWLFGQWILGQATGGAAVVKDVASDNTNAAQVIVTKGDNSTTAVKINKVFTGASAGSTAGTVNFAVSGTTTPTTVTVPGVVKGVTAGSSAAKVNVALTDSTAELTIPGVVTGVAKDNTTNAQFIVTNSDNSTTAVKLHGVVTTPSWDETNLKLTLPVSDGTAVEVNIPKDIFLESGSYDITNKKIILTLNDPSSTKIEFSVADLIPIYVAKDTTTVDTTVTWNATTGKYEISGVVNVDDSTTNAITVTANGLHVNKTAFADATSFADLSTTVSNLAAATTTWGTF